MIFSFIYIKVQRNFFGSFNGYISTFNVLMSLELSVFNRLQKKLSININLALILLHSICYVYALSLACNSVFLSNLLHTKGFRFISQSYFYHISVQSHWIEAIEVLPTSIASIQCDYIFTRIITKVFVLDTFFRKFAPESIIYYLISPCH